MMPLKNSSKPAAVGSLAAEVKENIGVNVAGGFIERGYGFTD